MLLPVLLLIVVQFVYLFTKSHYYNQYNIIFFAVTSRIFTTN